MSKLACPRCWDRDCNCGYDPFADKKEEVPYTPPDCECCDIVKALNDGKRLVKEMFEAHEAFGLCDYPSGKLHHIWMEKERELKEWSGK